MPRPRKAWEQARNHKRHRRGEGLEKVQKRRRGPKGWEEVQKPTKSLEEAPREEARGLEEARGPEKAGNRTKLGQNSGHEPYTISMNPKL